jgi:hypothetical protein
MNQKNILFIGLYQCRFCLFLTTKVILYQEGPSLFSLLSSLF